LGSVRPWLGRATAEGLLDPIRETPDQKTLQQWLYQAMVALSQDGITAVRTPDGVAAFRAYQCLLQQDRLPVRIGFYYPDGYVDSLARTGVRAPFGNDRLAVCGLKAFIDGALGSQTAEMFDCYEKAPDNLGISTMSDSEVLDLFTKATEAGLPVAIHAIGDKANHRVLDVAERVRKSLPNIPWPRHSIEHAQLLTREDIARMAEVGLIASMQPLHVSGDWKMADRHWGQRSKGAYAFRSLLNVRARLAFGSDCPVEEASPMLGMRAAVTRTDLDCQPEGGWYPEEKLTPMEALAAYTLQGSYAMGFESQIGSLAEGKKADLVVLDCDLLASDPFEWSSERVVLTMMNGQITHHRGDLKLE
ncbi:MAG TPA: amidohydrolase family protein, partial [bacterium]|nr:amidohydrolase family protein [bacterium]